MPMRPRRSRTLVAEKMACLEKDVAKTDRYNLLLRHVWLVNGMLVNYAGVPLSEQPSNCDPNCEGTCIPIVDYDLDCPDVGATNFRSVDSDPHRFDGDKDSIVCEE